MHSEEEEWARRRGIGGMVFEAWWTYLDVRGSIVTCEMNWKRKLPRPELEQSKARSEEEDGGTGDTEPPNLFKECGI